MAWRDPKQPRGRSENWSQPGCETVVPGAPLDLERSAEDVVLLHMRGRVRRPQTERRVQTRRVFLTASEKITEVLCPIINSFTASKRTGLTANESVTLRWVVSGATRLQLRKGNGTWETVTGSSKTVTITAAHTVYTLRAWCGTTYIDRKIALVQAQAVPLIASFTAAPNKVTAGTNVQLRWNVAGATQVQYRAGTGNWITVTGSSVTVQVAATTTFSLRATNAAGTTETGDAEQPPAQTVTVGTAPTAGAFTVNDDKVTAGTSVTFTWTPEAGVAYSIDQGVGAVSGGSKAVTVNATTTYTLTATNDFGTVSYAPVTVTVGTAPAISSFSASRTHITATQSTQLQWSVTGADDDGLSIDQGVGAVTGTSKTVTPGSTKSYTLTATNAFGTTTSSPVTVTVGAKPAVPVLTASPTTVESATDTTTLSWTPVSGETYSIDQGVGAVTGNSKVVTPGSTKTYRITATNAFGSTVSAGVTVTVGAAPMIGSFTVNDDKVVTGTQVTLSWTATGNPTPTFELDNGIGAVTGTSRQVTVTQTTTFTLTASNGVGTPATATVTVTVGTKPSVTKSIAYPQDSCSSGSVKARITAVVSGADTTEYQFASEPYTTFPGGPNGTLTWDSACFGAANIPGVATTTFVRARNDFGETIA